MPTNFRERFYIISNRFLLALGVFGCLAGCSSMLYHPTSFKYIDPKQMSAKYEEVRFASLAKKDGKGVQLVGWYFPVEKPRALMIVFHGNAENLSSHFLNFYWLTQNNVSFMIFDYQGYGASEGEPSPEGTVQDGRAAIDWGVAKASELSTDLVVFGQSLGGAIAMRSIVESKHRESIRFLAVDSTFASYQSVGASVLSNHWLTWPFQWLSYLVISDRWAPEEQIPRISPIPLLVIHGDQDGVVDVEHGEEVFELAGEPKEFWRIDGGRHTDVFRREDYQKRFIEKLNEVLK